MNDPWMDEWYALTEAERQHQRSLWAQRTMAERVIAGWELADNLDREQSVVPPITGITLTRVFRTS